MGESLTIMINLLVYPIAIIIAIIFFTLIHNVYKEDK